MQFKSPEVKAYGAFVFAAAPIIQCKSLFVNFIILTLNCGKPVKQIEKATCFSKQVAFCRIKLNYLHLMQFRVSGTQTVEPGCAKFGCGAVFYPKPYQTAKIQSTTMIQLTNSLLLQPVN
jgi:hypothetical protein